MIPQDYPSIASVIVALTRVLEVADYTSTVDVHVRDAANKKLQELIESL
jgi:hypothetical protein